MPFISVENLKDFKDRLDGTVGAKIGATGTTVSLKDKAGNVLSSASIDVPVYAEATTNKAGLLAAADKEKLDGIAAGATKVTSSTNGTVLINGAQTTVYTHPSHTAHDKGLYLVQVDGRGHVIAVSAVQKSDIVALGIPGQDTTYSAATSAKAGLQSAADKSKLDGITAGAEVNKIESVKVNGSALAITGKSVNLDLSVYALKSDITQAIKYKGSVKTFADLPTSAAVGDMYNVEAADADHGITAGENVVYNGTTWDALGGVFSVQPATTEQIAALFD